MSKNYFSSQGLTGFDFHDALCIRKDVYFHPFFNFHYIAVSASQTEIGKIFFWQKQCVICIRCVHFSCP